MTRIIKPIYISYKFYLHCYLKEKAGRLIEEEEKHIPEDLTRKTKGILVGIKNKLDYKLLPIELPNGRLLL